MAIDITNQEVIRHLTLDNLIDDATERNDKTALRWLEDEAYKEDERTRKDGTTYKAARSIIAIRAEYLRKFLNYQPAKPDTAKAREAKKQKRKAALDDKFTAAFKKLEKK